MIRTYERELTAAEKRHLSASITAAGKDLTRNYLLKEIAQTTVAALAAALILSLWKETTLLGGMSVAFPTAFVIYVIAIFERYKKRKKRTQELRAAQLENKASITEVQASAFADFEEFEDLGALFVFQVEPDKLLILQGQEYYETNRFPSLSFSIVEIGSVVFSIRPSSPKAKPVKIFGPEIMRTVRPMPHLAVVSGSLDNILDALAQQRAPGDSQKPRT